ncbi:MULTISPECIES: hypothetical protein [Haloferax]|nr:hypothetical protein [Haloferax marinisediminis]
MNLAGPEFTYADALFEVASAQGSVGRLEIIPLLVFFRSILYGMNP